MASRRTAARSVSGTGRSLSDDGSSRPGACSYLSNVRPENRSTLCSVIAHLAEETQPLFETTLKSRAVSENCNVKFSCVVTGHPTPQVIWYKDDTQLDRYCGLPKYEIFRNGKSHSLHIYNCTAEDAAIYQASASNVKGIVSCSGVLEVGEMNEFKIHQRYFAKLKQKAEHRCREAEGKENLEPLRTISPERTQRKRRSTMEAFLSTPSSTEDEGNEESNPDVPVETGTRLQEATEDNVDEKLLPVADGEVSVGNSVNENGGTHTHDAAQKVFTTHQLKTPSVKKKIKISNSAKADARVPGERRMKEENLAAAALACKASAWSGGTSEEVMEVENTVRSLVVQTDTRNVLRKHQKSAADEAVLRKRPSEDEHAHVGPSQRERLAASPAGLTAALTSAGHTVSGTQGKRAAKREMTAGRRASAEDAENKNRSPCRVATHSKLSTLPTRVQQYIGKREDVVDVDQNGGSHGHVNPEEMPYQNRPTLPQRLCEQAGDQLSEKEVSQKNASVSRPTRPSETVQARTTLKRNDAPVGLELPPEWRSTDAQPPPRKTQPKREATTDDTHIFSSNCGFQAPVDKMTQGTCDHFRGSSEINTVLTGLHKAALDSPDGGENILQSQVDTVVESGETVQIQTDEKVESKDVGKLLVQDDGTAPNEHTETESAAPQNVEQHKESGSERSGPMPHIAESSSASQDIKPDQPEPGVDQAYLKKTNKLEKTIGFKEIPKPVSKVISVAELLRAQLKALESTLMNPVPTADVQVDRVLAPASTGTEMRQSKEDDGKCSPEEKKSGPDRKITDDTNLKATLMEIYRQLNTDSGTEPMQTQAATCPPVQASQNLVSDLKAKESEASARVHQVDYPAASRTEMENVHHKCQPLASPNEPTGTHTKASGPTSNRDVLEQAKDEPVHHKNTEVVQKLPPGVQLNSKTESGISDTNSTTSDQCKIDDRSINSSLLQSGHTEGVKEKGQLQQDGSVVANHAPEVSLLLKNTNCISPTMSATPQELASGARRKILTPRTQPGEATEGPSAAENPNLNGMGSTTPASLPTSPSLSRRSPLLQPPAEQTSTVERRSPLVSRRKTPVENQQPAEEVEGKPAEKKKHYPFKAPQVIRKVRSETFAEASGHLKLWCQFFNVLSDSTVTWYRNGEEIARMSRKAGDETRVNLAIVQTSCKDSGVYRCSITNDYGTDSTDLPLSSDILAGLSLCEDLGVGEEIEMTPLIFSKGVADSGVWGDRLFGRVMMRESHLGDGWSHKVWRAKVIYGLEPVFESGDACVIKAPNPIGYGGREESGLVDRNLEIVKQGCKIQNLAREYCKIFSAEARLVESFGPCLEVIPVYLMYRPANPVPYATMEAELTGAYQKYLLPDDAGWMDSRTSSWVEQKCCALQHWIHQWTNGNLLLTRLEGVDTKITNVGISVKSTGHQGLSMEGDPKVFEQFVSQHQCNYFCGLLGLRSLKVMDSLLAPTKPKASRSPLLQRKMAAGSSSPQSGRKAAGSPRLSRKAEQEGRKTPTKQKAAEAPKNP